MTARHCLVTYHEISLKGRNRITFERRLRDNLKTALDGFPVGRITRLSSRLAVPVFDPAAAPAVAARIAELPGVNTVAIAEKTTQHLDAIGEAALTLLAEHGAFGTYAVVSKRSNTDFPTRSLDINRVIGALIGERTGAKVDLGDPDVTVSVMVVQGDAFVSVEKVRGAGGLPVGTAGRLVSLLSSGIDSPVATWRMMRRGAVVTGVHFSGRPQVSADSERLVARIGSVLERTGALGRIYVVPFGDVQREASLLVPPDLRVLIYRRLMIRVAERIAHVERARALVTGESLGQVASQTLDNIAAVDEVATLPMLRPLIGSDKLEIMAEARALGTYELSIQDAPDCCTLFMPRTPETHARLDAVLDAWHAIDHERMVEESLDSLEWLDYRSPAYRPPRRWPTPAGAPGSSVAATRA